MKPSINNAVTFWTDSATLAIFDPSCLESRLGDDFDWWCGSFKDIEEVYNGTVAFISTSADGTFKVRITTDDLFPDERDYASEKLSLGLKVISGTVFVGKGECITADGLSPTTESIQSGEGDFIQLQAGDYELTAYSINWFASPRWWNEEFKISEDAPADFVVVVRPRIVEFTGLKEEPRFDNLRGKFLFESNTRQIGPAPGKLLSSVVRKSPDGLSLKDAGPCSYKLILPDFSGLAWRDKVKVRVIKVDHTASTAIVEFVEKISS